MLTTFLCYIYERIIIIIIMHHTGGCVVGWLSDLYSIPEMVREANGDPVHLEKMFALRRAHQRPPFAVGTFFNSMMVAYFWAQLCMVAIPDVEVFGVNLSCLHWLVPLVVALGRWCLLRVFCGSCELCCY